MDRFALPSDAITLQPMLKDYNNLPCCVSCGNDCQQEGQDTWDCLNSSEILTPPLSPEQETNPNNGLNNDMNLPTIDSLSNSLFPPPNTFVEELLSTTFGNDCPRVLPDLKDTCSELFSFESQHPGDPMRKVFSQASSKDCMWNGRGFRPPVRSQSRGESPCSPICSPVSGCVDPRSVFHQPGGRRKSSSPRRKRLSSRAETPSDSEEEVDVVTVEKNSMRVFKRLPEGHSPDESKVLNKLVQKSDGSQHRITLVTTGRNQLGAPNNQQNRGRTPRKTKGQPMAMMMQGGKTVQLKCLPIKSTENNVTFKRKLNGTLDTAPGKTLLRLMRIAPTSTTASKTESGNREKSLYSLKGLSTLGGTRIKQLPKVPTPGRIKHDPIDIKVGLPQQNHQSPVFSPVPGVEKKKTTKKGTKRAASSVSFETPTSSPGSTNGEFPQSPKRRNGTRLSGAEEESIREAHNVLERQRREGLRNLYHNLRLVVPEVAELEKAPKVNILTKAREHVIALQAQTANLRLRKAHEQERQSKLEQRLHELIASPSMTSYTNSVYFKREFTDSLPKFTYLC